MGFWSLHGTCSLCWSDAVMDEAGDGWERRWLELEGCDFPLAIHHLWEEENEGGQVK